MYTYLIVDDEMIERKGIRMLLSRMNIRENILEASNGEEALEVFEKEKIDVLLTDINMPFMDGIELLSRIHEEYPGTETVIFSGYDEFSYAKKAISYGVSAYILKPVNPEEFEKVVGEINEKLAKSEREEKRKDESMEFLREHLLYLMVNGQSRNAMQEKTQTLLDMSFVRDFCRAEDILDYRTLNLILQPLAENAIAHGIDRRRGSEPGVITISGRRDGNCVVLSVADNGVGMEQEKAQTILTEKSSGYGVRNVNSRIQLEYGEAYGLSIESEPGKGTKVTVRIPGVEREVQA